MSVRLNRNLGPVGCLDPGEWTAETASGLPALRCRGCEEVVEFDAVTYQIDLAGHVAPRWKCSTPLCAYSEWITLTDYAEDVLE